MIDVKNLSKTFRLYRKPSDRLREILFKRSYHIEHRALHGISFEVKDGETLGIIGINGAGKSTLLKILTGVLLPDSGSIRIDGKITGLLELGTGFNMELTGLQNIFINGMLLGMSKEEIGQKCKSIVLFSELNDFIHEPMKTYSSGMVVRLAFATAVHAEQKCFVVDEALSVGDAHFQQKCISRIKEFCNQGGSIIFVSHDMNAVKMLCDKAILLDQGTIVEEGDPDTVVNTYNFLIAKMGDQNDRMMLLQGEERHAYGNLDIEIVHVALIGEQSFSSMVSTGEQVIIRLVIKAHCDTDDVSVGILIRDKYGQDIFGTNTFLLGHKIRVQRDCYYDINFSLRMDIGPGKYTITAAVHTDETHLDKCYHWCDHVASFEVIRGYGNVFTGICKLYPTVSSEKRNVHAEN